MNGLNSGMILTNAAAEGNSSLALICFVISLAVTVLILAAQWKLYVKAGEAGWKVLIPLYNNYILFKIVYGNGWKFLFMFVPVLNMIFSIATCIRLAQVYGKGVGFGILTIFFIPVTTCILAFGSAEYVGPVDKFF